MSTETTEQTSQTPRRRIRMERGQGPLRTQIRAGFRWRPSIFLLGAVAGSTMAYAIALLAIAQR